METKFAFFLALFSSTCANMLMDESESESFDGKEENMFEVDLIPYENEYEDNNVRDQRRGNSYYPGSFDPADIQADLIPMYDYNNDDESPNSEIPPPPQSRRTPMSPDAPHPVGGAPKMDFDVFVKHRLLDDGRVVFEPQIRRSGPQAIGSRVSEEVPQESDMSMADMIETTPPPRRRIVRRRIIRRKDGKPGRVVRIVKKPVA